MLHDEYAYYRVPLVECSFVDAGMYIDGHLRKSSFLGFDFYHFSRRIMKCFMPGHFGPGPPTTSPFRQSFYSGEDDFKFITLSDYSPAAGDRRRLMPYFRREIAFEF